jgi:hypothetical protein
MKNIPASVLLNVLNNADSSFIRDVSPIIQEIKNAQAQLGVKQLFIEINTDEDFFVNGEYSYSGAFPLGDSFVGQVYLNALKNLTFTPLKGKEERLERFLGFIRELSVLSDLTQAGRAETGGNQTLTAYVHTPTKVLHFGSVVIDLQS